MKYLAKSNLAKVCGGQANHERQLCIGCGSGYPRNNNERKEYNYPDLAAKRDNTRNRNFRF